MNHIPAPETVSEGDPLHDALAAIRPAQTDAYASSMRASVRRDLFGATSEPFRLGRFTVLEPLGGGAMGVVFVAYDPDLDRKIALKVLRNRGERGRREVLREGRALARLKHPNVVGVYEVGVLGDDVFVAMEYVEGKNLREWLREPRSSEAILARLIEAGRGLAAAHAVELVHRDCKPENLVVDAQGHARVIDFGLARPLEDLAGPGTAATNPATGSVSVHGGTPAYMAPELLAGAAADHASDQYSFCVTCWEALFGARPGDGRPEPASARSGPGWVRRVLERGLAPAPARRWPSMAALLSALAQGKRRSRIWQAAAVLLGVAALAGVAEGVRRRDLAQQVVTCEAAGAEIDAVWNDDARQRLRDGFAATRVSFDVATTERVFPRLDEQAAAWKQARTEACLNAGLRGRWSADLGERAGFCLEDRQLELAGLVAEFEQADGLAVRMAVMAVTRLKPPQACLDEGLLQRQPAPPEGEREVFTEVRAGLSRARALQLAGKYPAALAAATAARVRAEEALDWPPLWAAARATEGALLDETGAYAAAETASKEAYFAAARAAAWGVAAEAALRLIMVAGVRQARHEEGRTWAAHAELALAHAGDWSGLNESRRLSLLAIVREEAGAHAEARTLYEQALAIREAALGPDHPDRAASLSDLGNVSFTSGAYIEARALFERCLAIQEKVLGPEHPSVGGTINNIANTYLLTGDNAEAQPRYEQALRIVEPTLGAEHPMVVQTMSNLAAVYTYTGATTEARALFERCLALQEKQSGPDDLAITNALFNLASLDYMAGAYVDARARTERVLAIQEKALGAEHPRVASTLVVLANVHAITGAAAVARPLYERALAIQEKALGPEHSQLAETLWRLGELDLDMKRPAQALPRLERAVAAYSANEGTQVGEHQARFAMARALLATPGDRGRALAEARTARDGLRHGATEAKELAEVERWLAERAAEQ